MIDIEKVVREYIDKSLHMSIATTVDNRPWVSEVHFAYDDDLNLYWRSLTNRRHSQEIAKNPSVAGDIVKQHALNESPHAIYFEGTAKVLTAGKEQDQAFNALKNRKIADDDAFDEAKDPGGHQFYKATVDKWYAFGKFDGGEVQKYELAWNGGKK
jgi:uncharacterized protein YhbP (UPF0306 family)